jgi:hypothetical protein
LEALGLDGYNFGDDLFIGSGAPIVQAGAVAIKASAHRVAKNLTANAALILRSLLSNEYGGSLVWIVNDSTNDIRVYPFVGENLNGAANSFLTVTAGNAAVLMRIPTQTKRGGGTFGGGTLDWRGVLIS